MEAREDYANAFFHVQHELLGEQVRDQQSLREGELMAVLREPVGQLAGLTKYASTAYVRSTDGREFSADPTKLVRV